MDNIATKRNSGIDFLRILSMFYVVVLHTLGQGGILNSVQPNTPQYMISWFIEIWAYCAVDIFALVSGFVGYRDEAKIPKFSSYILLWMQVVFYGILVTLFFYFLAPELVTKNDLLQMLFPVSNNLYWYFTAYTGLFICMPLLNIALSKCSKALSIKIFITLFLMFSVYDTIVNKFGLNRGYSFAWLVILYVFGSILKKCEVGKNINIFMATTGIIILVVFTWLSKIYMVDWKLGNAAITSDTFISYTSPTILGTALLYVIGFSKIKFNYFKNFITFSGSKAFAAYILNNQKFIWIYIVTQRFAPWAKLSPLTLLINVFMFSGFFVIMSIMVDAIRDRLFKLLCIYQFSNYIGEKLKVLFVHFIQE